MSTIALPTILGLLAVGAFLASLVGRAWWVRRSGQRAAALDVSAHWGSLIERSRDMASIAAFDRLAAKPADESYVLGERTWRDLSMEAVFAQIDRAVSPLGQQMLYRVLRTPWLALRPLLELDRRVNAFASDETLRSRTTSALRPLAAPSAAALAEVIYGRQASMPRGASLFPLSTMATIAIAALCFVKPPLLLALFALVGINIYIRLSVFRDLSVHVEGLRQVAKLIEVARELTRLESVALSSELDEIRRALAALGSRRLGMAWLTLDRLRLDEASAMVVEYGNVFLLLDVNTYVKELAFAQAHNETLARIFEAVATIDASMAIANYRAGETTCSRPTLSARDGRFQAEGVCHPLVANAISNDVTLDERGYVITGSNMAGKSTFLKAVALQAVLAQTIFVTTCKRYAAPFLCVHTLVEIADDLLSSRSHFRVEAEVALSMLTAAPQVRRLCIVDELFRGTNTSDRIAAGAAFLSALHESGAHVIAATHDRELLALLAKEFEPHHFAETIVNDKLRFDYKLHAGAAAPRNALAVLRLVGFPDAVLDNARAIAAKLEAPEGVFDVWPAMRPPVSLAIADAAASPIAPRDDVPARAVGSAIPPATPSVGTADPRHDVRRTIGVGNKGSRLRSTIVTAAILVALPVIGIVRWRGQASGHAPSYETADAHKSDVRVTVRATGTLQSITTVEVGAEVTGRVLKVNVDANAAVKKGQILAIIDPEQLHAAANQASAQVAVSEASIRQSRATLNELVAKTERARRLRVEGLVGQGELEATEAELERAEANVSSATANATLSRAALASSLSRLDKATITSPIDGIVLARFIEPGQTVTSGFTTPVLFRLAHDLTQMRLNVDIDEADIGRVAVGMTATFAVEAYPNKTFASRVVSLSNEPKTSQNVVTYKAVLEVDNGDKLLRPGMTCTATIVAETKHDVLVVPNAAFRFVPPTTSIAIPEKKRAGVQDSGQRIWLFRDGELRPVSVHAGVSDGIITEVDEIDDLSGGAKVVTDVKAPL